MAKIVSGELHHNDNASIQFQSAIVLAVREVRKSFALLAASRKADEYAPGALHALRKLCDGERPSGHLHRQEVLEWQAGFAAWFRRVKKSFPVEFANQFQANLAEDFQAILSCSTEMPESFWRKEVDQRDIRITFANQEALNAARKAAEEKHPVPLGGALHKYIEQCLATLTVQPESPVPAAAPAPSVRSLELLTPRINLSDSRVASLLLDRFDCFDSPVMLSQDMVTTAYDLEHAVKQYLKQHGEEVLADLRFDCESSLFCVRSDRTGAITAVIDALMSFASNQELFAKYQQGPRE